MATNKDLEKIKKIYNEQMAHYCKKHFSIILDKPGLLPKIMQDNFEPNKWLIKDLIENKATNSFVSYVMNEYHKSYPAEQNVVVDELDPFVLTKNAGYQMKQCLEEQQVKDYMKYYANTKKEQLCTFGDINGRLKSHNVFFLVHENVDQIKRENFKNPKREDDYGTSVLSIQFNKKAFDGNYFCKILNRYNDVIIDSSPDATFGNNLDNIAPGLTNAFEDYLGISLKIKPSDLTITNYHKVRKDKFYKYTYASNNYFYCPNNIIIHGQQVIKFNKDDVLVFDKFVLNKNANSELNIRQYDRGSKFISIDSFENELQNLKKVDVTKIKLENDEVGTQIDIVDKNNRPVVIVLNQYNQMIEYQNNNIKEIPDYFLQNCPQLKKLTINNVQKIGDRFLEFNHTLQELNAKKLQSIGNKSVLNNHTIEKQNTPQLITQTNSQQPLCK